MATKTMGMWQCENGHEFPAEEMETEQAQLGHKYKCPVCKTQNIEEQ